jgi:protein TonB
MKPILRRRVTMLRWLLSLGTTILAACGAPAPAPSREVATAAPPVAAAAATAAGEAPTASAGRGPAAVKLAPRDPALEAWKRSVAERIHVANQKSLFEGRPHHLLQAVIVVEATVDKNGKVVASKVTRSPRIKRLDDMALASLKAASPLPAPPPMLLVRGNLVFSETWLVQNDNTFRVRTLAMPQE